MLLTAKYLFSPHSHDSQLNIDLHCRVIHVEVERNQQYLAAWCLFIVNTVHSYTGFVFSDIAPYFQQNDWYSYINRQGTRFAGDSPAVDIQEDGRHGRSKR